MTRTVHAMSVALEAARDQKERQDEYLESSPVVVVFKDPRPVGGDPSVGVFVERCGYSSVQAALSGLDEGRLPMGPAADGDIVMMKRGVHCLAAPMVLSSSVLVRRERNFSGGGGGGYSGGGGGGYACGGGGGGGSFITPRGIHSRAESGYVLRRGVRELVGHRGAGEVRIRDASLGGEWVLEHRKELHEWLAPERGLYLLRAMGASAADAGDHAGGTGAVLETHLRLERGQQLVALCGGMSRSYSDRMGACSGGGGATCLWLDEATAGNLLLCAGGGGPLPSPSPPAPPARAPVLPAA